MGLRIRLERHAHEGSADLLCPVMECDVCEQEIKDGDQGWYAFQIDGSTGEPANDGKLYYAHQGLCLNVLEDRLDQPDRYFQFLYLSELVGYLANNLNLEQAVERRKAMNW